MPNQDESTADPDQTYHCFCAKYCGIPGGQWKKKSTYHRHQEIERENQTSEIPVREHQRGNQTGRRTRSQRRSEHDSDDSDAGVSNAASIIQDDFEQEMPVDDSVLSLLNDPSIGQAAHPMAHSTHFFHPRKMEVVLMRGQTKLSGQSDQPVAHLYTPRPVSFTPPPVDAAFPTYTSKAPSSPSSNPSSPGGEGSTDSEGASSGARERTNRDRDKTWRLFVVSMEA
ncbi:hypothetical protein B0H17DRAFT_1340572 [Mycena rosella]|uniref:Uncharacterized protein n=1 Tax=Mycena rosella TaxID=1033263 RepID=A0AAD7FI80_MYCRO|nr:hypothetical protein B0H17DRAFT_1340572 [Mycena rosella]